MSSVVSSESVVHPSSLAALQSSAFRLYFAGQLVSVSGTWMQSVAQQVVVYDLTKSELALGLVACAQGLPSLLLTPFAGVIVERFSRRQILVVTQTIMMILAFILAALQFAGVTQVWHIVALSLGIGIANALDAPARQSFVIEMVGAEQLTSGIVLNSIMFNAARVIGPALGGYALAKFGAGWCFFLNGASFIAVIISLVLMHIKPVKRIAEPIAIWKPLIEGLRFSLHHETIKPLLFMSALTSIFGITFAVLVPAFANQILGDTGVGTANLLTAEGVGAILAGVVVANAHRIGLRGHILALSAVLGPIFLIFFAMSHSYLTALPFIGLTGFFMIMQFITMNTLLQVEVLDEYRGRVMSLYTLSFFGLSPFSSLLLGALGTSLGTVTALEIYGAVGFVLMLLLLWRYPQVLKLR